MVNALSCYAYDARHSVEREFLLSLLLLKPHDMILLNFCILLKPDKPNVKNMFWPFLVAFSHIK